MHDFFEEDGGGDDEISSSKTYWTNENSYNGVIMTRSRPKGTESERILARKNELVRN